MPKKTVDTAAEKARKQKIILAVGGVLLLGLAAFQGPKLMHRSGTPPPAPLTSATASSPDNPNGIPASAAAPATPAPAAAVVTGEPGAVVAGVPLPGAHTTQPGENQLISFTLFKAKDPFVPKVGDTQAASPAPAATTTGQPGPPAGAAAPTSETAKPTAPSAPIAFATITLNGAPQQVEVKGTFPEKGPLFVLRSLAKREAQIAVAGGSFDDGQTVKLPLGKKVTLVNTATGVRYELKLVYTGSAPEVIEGFTTDKQVSTNGSSTGSADAGSTGASTTDSAAGVSQPS